MTTYFGVSDKGSVRKLCELYIAHHADADWIHLLRALVPLISLEQLTVLDSILKQIYNLSYQRASYFYTDTSDFEEVLQPDRL
tara:strand:+ start:433 stop:681 length:249 start_codon:yes stop_codon:yes gene_type:complete